MAAKSLTKKDNMRRKSSKLDKSLILPTIPVKKK